jgi:hypothetical protein
VGCDADLDGDMLLFQWGTYDWGEGRYFHLNLTRQFILDGTGDDESIFQLGFTFLYTPSSALEALRDGTRWCGAPAELPEFQRLRHVVGGISCRTWTSPRQGATDL